jgi:hypothetical protein
LPEPARKPDSFEEPISKWRALLPPRAVLHVGVSVAAAAVVGLVTGSPALVFMLGVVGLCSLWREQDRATTGGVEERRVRPNDWVLLAFAVLGGCAWGVARLAESRAGELVGPGIAAILVLWLTAARMAIDARERDSAGEI